MKQIFKKQGISEFVGHSVFSSLVLKYSMYLFSTLSGVIRESKYSWKLHDSMEGTLCYHTRIGSKACHYSCTRHKMNNKSMWTWFVEISVHLLLNLWLIKIWKEIKRYKLLAMITPMKIEINFVLCISLSVISDSLWPHGP